MDFFLEGSESGINVLWRPKEACGFGESKLYKDFKLQYPNPHVVQESVVIALFKDIPMKQLYTVTNKK